MNRTHLTLLITLIVLATLSSVNATPAVTFDSPKTAEKYNIGDTVAVQGTITLDRDLRGATVSARAYSVVYNRTTSLGQRFYNFKANVPVSLSEIFPDGLNWVTVGNTQTSNDWKIAIDVEKTPVYSTSFETPLFTITKSLVLKPALSGYVFNYGDTLEITGTVTTAKGNPVQADGKISFQNPDTGDIKVVNITIKDGLLSYSYTFNQEDKPVSYTLILRAVDSNGNVGFITLTGVKVTDKLDLTCNIPKTEFLPGDVFAVSGTLTNAHSGIMPSITVNAYLDIASTNITQAYPAKTDESGNYQITIEPPKLVTPGQYTVKVIAEDTDQNIGKCEKDFFMNVKRDIAVDFKLNSSWYYNESEVDSEIKINNKGNIDIVGKVSLLVDSVEVVTQDFTAPRGLESTIKPFWVVTGTKGEHTVRAVIKQDSEILYQTKAIPFTLYPKPAPPVPPAAWQILIVIVLIVIGILSIVKKKELKYWWWHQELKSKYKIRK